jgi:hypothetical protein
MIEMTMINLSFLYKANGDSLPDPKIEISGEVLIVQGLEIATIDLLWSSASVNASRRASWFLHSGDDVQNWNYRGSISNSLQIGNV